MSNSSNNRGISSCSRLLCAIMWACVLNVYLAINLFVFEVVWIRCDVYVCLLCDMLKSTLQVQLRQLLGLAGLEPLVH
jgi:hypothetical protein